MQKNPNGKLNVGGTFKNYTIISAAEPHISINGKKRAWWFVQCNICNNVSKKAASGILRTQLGYCSRCPKELRPFNGADYTGRVFNNYTILRLADFRFTQNGTREIYWVAHCNICNTESELRHNGLPSYTKNYCKNCPEEIQKDALEHMIGKKFNRLTIQKRVRYEDRKVYYECLCDCGNITKVDSGNLKNNSTTSCGCVYTNERGQKNKLNLTGQKFGYLTVKYPVEPSAQGKTQWFCECDCGGTKVVHTVNLRGLKTISCGCKQSTWEARTAIHLNNRNIAHRQQVTFNDCKNVAHLRFDFGLYCEDKLLLVELHGDQHYRPVKRLTGNLAKSSLDAYAALVYRDNIKRQYCIDNNIPLLEIAYKDRKRTVEIMHTFYTEAVAAHTRGYENFRTFTIACNSKLILRPTTYVETHERKRPGGLCKKVCQFDLTTGNVIKIWGSLTEVVQTLGFSKLMLSNICNKKTYKRAYKGFGWVYYNEATSEEEIKSIVTTTDSQRKWLQYADRAILEVDKETHVVIKEWRNYREIQECTSYDYKRILAACTPKGLRTALTYGRVWLFKGDDIQAKLHKLVKPRKGTKRVVQQDAITHEVIHVWDSIQQVHNQLGYPVQTLVSVCTVKNVYKGYVWVYGAAW